jgi:hypothetical protein
MISLIYYNSITLRSLKIFLRWSSIFQTGNEWTDRFTRIPLPDDLWKYSRSVRIFLRQAMSELMDLLEFCYPAISENILALKEYFWDRQWVNWSIYYDSLTLWSLKIFLRGRSILRQAMNELSKIVWFHYSVISENILGLKWYFSRQQMREWTKIIWFHYPAISENILALNDYFWDMQWMNLPN